ncbi:MAG TPA: PQQ-binding-like beta-propeller repeat protein [Rhizomicrobium sp.]|nr:PQQ-binding-like beta-propeller repeat protein [Rhizomicrobium sp.]
MSRKTKFLASAMAAVSLGGAYALAQGAAGPFTQAQVTQGRADYIANCAGCHTANLGGGGDAPALTGATFNSSWATKSTKEFYQFVSTSMPYGNAGNLSPETYSNIIAFILAANGARPGTAPLNAGTDVRINSVANGQLVAQVVSGAPAGGAPQGGQQAAARGPRGPGAMPLGWTVQGTIKNYHDVTDDNLVHPADGDWLMGRRTYAGWSYSPLTQINTQNVNQLQLQWAWAMMPGGAVEVSPEVHDGIMFLSNTSNTIQAIDAKTGELIWENRLGPLASAAYSGTRSIGLYKDKVFFASTDAKMHALDARTGKEVWVTTIDTPPKSETGGVTVIHGKVLTGLMGCDTFSVNGCYISAYDVDTGKQLWKFQTNAQSNQPGGDTWNGLPDNVRGGTDTWIAGSYDPELNTTYWGVAQAKPWMRASRGTGANAALYSTSTLALDPDTGKLKWYFQHVPGESLDLDVVFERVLIDHGDQKTVMTIGKDGLLWKLDRVTGKFLDVKETVFQNVFQKIDHKTGAVLYRDDILNQKTGQYYASCPGPEGGKDWPPMSYNQASDLLLIPEAQSCVMMAGREVDKKVGGGGTAGTQLFYFMPGTNQNMGHLFAINTSTMQTAWDWQQRAPFLSGVVSTAGGVGFVGDFNREWKAFDVRTGKILWRTRLGQTVEGFPTSYAVDGRQYVAVTVGTGGGSPEQKPSTLLTEVHRPIEGNGHQLYVWALPSGNS